MNDMASKFIVLQLLFIMCASVAVGSRKIRRNGAKHAGPPEFSLKVSVALLVGFVTIMFLFYCSIIRPRSEARRVQQHKKLNNFLTELYDTEISMKPSWSDTEYADIRGSVREIVKEIIFETFSSSDSLLQITKENARLHIELVGSCQEKSKIRRPDEFDFSVRFPHFSKENVVVERGLIKPGMFMCIHKNVSFEYDNAFVQLQYTGQLPETSCISSLVTKVGDIYYISAFKIHTFYKSKVRSVVETMVRNQYRVTKKTGMLVVQLPNENVYNAEENGPAWTLPLIWKKGSREQFTIHVDLVPVILTGEPSTRITFETFDSTTVEQVRFMAYPAICNMLGNERYEYMSDRKNMKGGTYSLTYEDVMRNASKENKLFTELSFLTSHVRYENALMKEVRKSYESLFICFQILKCMEHFWSRYKAKGRLHGLRFHSYILKTLVLKEVIDGNVDKHDDLATCFKLLLKRMIDLSESCLRGNHVSINSLWFDEHILTCAQLPQTYTYNDYYLHAFRQQLTPLLGLLDTISKDSDYNNFRYKKMFLNIVREQVNYRVISGDNDTEAF